MSSATTAAGVFGFCLSGALGTFFWHVQRSELRYLRVCTSVSASINFNAVRAAAAAADWQIMAEHAPDRLQARTAGTLLTVGERVDVLCCGGDVLIACICDPSVGFSLAGRRRCARHRDHIRSAVNSASFPNVGSSGTDHWDTAQ